MQITTRAAKTGTLVLVVAGLGAGVLHGLPEPVDVPISPTTERDPGAWAMPLDGYVLPAASKVSYAENLLEQPCLRKAGIDDPPPWATIDGLQAEDDAQDTAARANPSPALATTRPLTSALAASRGYHGPSTAGANADGMRAWGYDPDRTAAFAALPEGADLRCVRAVRAELGTDQSGRVQEASELAQRLTYLAAVAARADSTVVTAAGRWRDCMAPAAVADLPAAPEDMPTPSMGVAVRDGDVRVVTPAVGTAEVAVAERDAACQDSTGYRRALYDAQWSRMLHVTASDAAVLRQGSRRQPVIEARVDRVIARLAPAAPADVD